MSEFSPGMPTVPVAVVTTVDEVARSIRAAMFGGQLVPGASLKENALASSLGVSRGSIREAIRVLTAEGLIEHKPHRGAIVAEVTREGLNDIFQARQICELAAVDAVFASSPTKRSLLHQSSFTAMEQAVACMRVAAGAGDIAGIFAMDLEFHRRLVGSLENNRLLTFYVRAQSELRLIANRADAEGNLDDFALTHQLLLDQLLGPSKAAARSGVLAHLADGHVKFDSARQTFASFSSSQPSSATTSAVRRTRRQV